MRGRGEAPLEDLRGQRGRPQRRRPPGGLGRGVEVIDDEAGDAVVR